MCTIVATPFATSVQWYRHVNGVQTGLHNVVGKYNTPTVNSPNLRMISHVYVLGVSMSVQRQDNDQSCICVRCIDVCTKIG